MDIQICLSKPEDLDDILELQANAIRTLLSTYNLHQIESLVRSQKAVRLNEKEKETIFVAELKDEIVGFACFSVQCNIIGGVYVNPDFVRKGIGTRLLQEIEKLAVENHHRKIQVISSLPSVNFYQSNNYYKAFNHVFHFEPETGVACTVLQKRFDSYDSIEKLFFWVREKFL